MDGVHMTLEEYRAKSPYARKLELDYYVAQILNLFAVHELTYNQISYIIEILERQVKQRTRITKGQIQDLQEVRKDIEESVRYGYEHRNHAQFW